VRRFPQEMDEEAEAVLRAKVNAFVLGLVTDENDELRREATLAAGNIGLGEAMAVPFLVKAYTAAPSWIMLHALAQTGSDNAVRALVRLSHTAKPELGNDGLQGVIRALGQTKSPLAAPRLRELLDRVGEIGDAGERVCDEAVRALSTIFPDGPKLPPRPDRAALDKAVEAWKQFLGAQKNGT